MKGRYWVTGTVIVFAVAFLSSIFVFSRIRTRNMSFEGSFPSIEDVAVENLKILAQKRIFFGHQSVGENVIEGLDEILIQFDEICLNIVEGNEISSVDGKALIHSKIGRNSRPSSKIRAFKKIMESGSGNNVDIALMKFCYVDFEYGSSPQDIFEEYQVGISDLKAQFPDVVFVHMTVPIESSPTGPTGLLKEMIKVVIRRPGVVEKNSVRETYNRLMRSTYSGTEPIFDIALIESIGPDGKRRYRGTDTEKVFQMDSRYTYDGGHLNRLGRKHVAEQFLITLAEVAGSDVN